MWSLRSVWQTGYRTKQYGHAATWSVAADGWTYKTEERRRMSSLKPSGNTRKQRETGGKNRKKRGLAANSGRKRKQPAKPTESLVRDQKAAGKGFDRCRWQKKGETFPMSKGGWQAKSEAGRLLRIEARRGIYEKGYFLLDSIFQNQRKSTLWEFRIFDDTQ